MFGRQLIVVGWRVKAVEDLNFVLTRSSSPVKIH
jgi:hypothetical protein